MEIMRISNTSLTLRQQNRAFLTFGVMLYKLCSTYLQSLQDYSHFAADTALNHCIQCRQKLTELNASFRI